MATGDVVFFEQFFEDEARKVHNLETDTIKCALVNNTVVPTAATAGPHFGGTGTTNLATNEVSGSGYTAGGEDIAATAGLSAGDLVFDGDTNPSWAKTAGGPTDIYWGIIYNDTDANKRAIAYVEMGGPVSIVAGQVSITWNVSGIGSKGAA